ncbi:MAG: HDIG domain-containing protein [Lachnospiraceae bacterium]|nr:HDIG domain-containing protein [Lachnospiraceae bacterium]
MKKPIAMEQEMSGTTGSGSEDMRIQKMNPQKYGLLKIFMIAVVAVITYAAVFTSYYVDDKKTVEVGGVSPERYVATKDIIDEAATGKLKENAEALVGSLYKYDAEAQEASLSKLDSFFDTLDKYVDMLNSDSEENVSDGATFEIPVALSNSQYKDYAELSTNGKTEYKSEIRNIATYVFEQGITEEYLATALKSVEDKIEETQWNYNLKNMGYSVISKILSPNMIIDEEAIEAAKQLKASEVKPVMIMKNQKIVDEGEVITQEIYDVLLSLDLINNEESKNTVSLLGCMAIVTLLMIGAVFFIKEQSGRRPVKINELLILFTAYIITLLIIKLMYKVTSYIFIPLSLFAMLVSVLISTRMAIILNILVTIASYFVFNGNADFIIYFLITGTIAAYLVKHTEKRQQILAVAVGIGITNFICAFALGMIADNAYSLGLVKTGLYGMLVGIITVIVVIGSLPFWESVFEVNSSLKLLELIRPDNYLMRRLMIEAPGTYHHSLIVANMAEAAAIELGANATIARVGAYYHDIGKLRNPAYFSENQMGENPHDFMEPERSAKVIMDHVKYGRELADEYKLPKAIKNMIKEHHGTTLVKYFYLKAVKQYGREEVKEEDYRYPGVTPKSRETAIVMLADTCEAAVRSIFSEGKNAADIEEIIKTLIKDKLDDGQLDDCDLTIKDLSVMRKAFLKIFQGMYHERVSYPKDEKAEEDKP